MSVRTYSMEQNYSWEAIRFSACQEIAYVLSLVSVQNVKNTHHFIAQNSMWIVSSGVWWEQCVRRARSVVLRIVLLYCYAMSLGK